MNTEDINQIEALVQSDDLVVHLQQKIQRIYEFVPAHDDVNQLVSSFEAIADLPTKRTPHYAVLFYWSLMILYFDDIEGLAHQFDIPLHQTSLRSLGIGMNILLSGKGANFKYQTFTSVNRYKNLYEFVADCVAEGYNYERPLNGWREILEFIYHINPTWYYDLIDHDVGNIFFLLAVGYSPLQHNPQEFVHFLKSSDPIKANGAFYFLVRHETPQAVLAHLSHLETQHIVSMLLNYVFYEQQIPMEFVNFLAKQDPKLVVSATERQLDMSNPLKLIKIGIFINQSVEYQRLFCRNLKSWIIVEGNIGIWNSAKESVRTILNHVTNAVRDKLLIDLNSAQNVMYLTNFDRQIRSSKYEKDRFKAQIVEDVLRQFGPV